MRVALRSVGAGHDDRVGVGPNSGNQCYHFAGYVLRFASEIRIPIRWGGDWDRDLDVNDQNFKLFGGQGLAEKCLNGLVKHVGAVAGANSHREFRIAHKRRADSKDRTVRSTVERKSRGL